MVAGAQAGIMTPFPVMWFPPIRRRACSMTSPAVSCLATMCPRLSCRRVMLPVWVLDTAFYAGQGFGTPGDQLGDGCAIVGGASSGLKISHLALHAISPSLCGGLCGERTGLVFVTFAAHHSAPPAVAVLQCCHRCAIPCCAKACLAHEWYRGTGKRGKYRE